eukprot:Em0285g6a
MQAPYAQYELQPANRSTNGRQLSSPTESANSDVLITPRYKRARSGGGTFRWPDILRAVIGSLLFVTALSLTVLSKLSVISMTSRLNVMNETGMEEEPARNGGKSEAVGLYWQLLLAMVLPSVFTLFRTLLLGMCGKQTVNFLGLRRRLLSCLPSIAAVLVMNGVFVFQAGYECFQLRWCGHGRARKYTDEAGEGTPAACRNFIARMLTALLENKFTRFFALVLQLGALVAMAVYIGLMDRSSQGLSLAITLPVCLLTLSAVWCTKVQQWKNECTIIANRAAGANIIRVSAVDRPTSRYKSNFINAILRIILYPLFRMSFFDMSSPKTALIHGACTKPALSPSPSSERARVGHLSDPNTQQLLWVHFHVDFLHHGAPPLGASPPHVPLHSHFRGVGAFSVFYKSSFGIPMELLYKEDIILILISIGLWVGQMLGKGLYIWQEEKHHIGKRH